MNFNASPYYDDYNEDKRFLRVLFRPGYSVQARELTQAQTILQKQVSRIGDYMFKNKSRVIPGELVTTTCHSIKLEPTEIDTSALLDTFIPALDNITIKGETSGIRATLILAEASTTTGDPALFHIKYVTEGLNGEKEFLQNEILSFTVSSVEQTTTTGGSSPSDPVITTTTNVAPTYTDPRTGEVITANTGDYRVRIQNVTDYTNYSTVAQITHGIFYVNGAFVKVDTQRISISKYTNTPTLSVGLDIVEEIVTPEQDISLLDNSSGTPNYTAPGAHRYKMSLVLTAKDIGYSSENFILLSTFRKGGLQFEAKGTDLAELENLLARRTFDESGDYTVRPFELEMREHRNSDQSQWTGLANYQEGDVVFYTNPTSKKVNYYVCLDSGVSGTAPPTHVSGAVSDGGVRWRYTTSPMYDYGVYNDADGGDTDKLAFGLKNGKAYIKGYEFETHGVRYVSAPKARSYSKIKNTGISTNLGNLIDVIPFGVPNVDGYQIVDLYRVDTPPNAAGNMGTIAASIDASGTATPNNAVAKLNYAIVGYQASATSATEYHVAKLLANNATTTTFPVPMTTWAGLNGASQAYGSYLTTSKIGTARLRYFEANDPVNGRATAKVSLMDVQMDPGQDFRKVRVIGTPLSQGSTSAGGDPTCFRALVIPTSYNSVSIGQSTVATSGTTGNNVDLTGLGTKWLSANNVSAGDMVWFPNSPTQFFFVRDLQGSDRGMKVNTWANFSVSGPLQRADCVYQFPEDGDSIFNMPKNDVLTIRGGETLQENNTTYTTLEKFVVTGDAGATFVTLNFSVPDPDQVVISDRNSYIVVNNTTGEMVLPYDVTLTSVNTGAIRLNAASTRSGDITKLQNDSYTIFVPSLKRLTNAKEKVKSLLSTSIDLTLQTTVELDTIKLAKADVFRILKVEMFPNVIFGNDISSQITGTGIDITSNYEFDNGQRDTHYDLARLIKGKAVPYPSGPIRITFEYFEHTSGDYFSVDSYPDLLYAEIPNYFSKVTGRTVSMRDVLDFRPRVNDGGTFDGGNASLTALPQRKYGLQCDFAYYLPRKDKIVLNKAGNFVVIQGVSSDNPQLPQAPSDSMELYDVEYKPYTYGANTSNISIKPIDNRRFTMRDIAKIEKRLSTLEQQTALTLLERTTAAFSIKDQDGLDRFKNGFAVDNFSGHSVGNVLDADYECSIDIVDRFLRPSFNTVGVDLVEQASSVVERNAAGYRMHEGNIITLPYYTGAQYFYKNKNEIQAIINKGTAATAADLSRKETLIRDNNDMCVLEQPYATDAIAIAALTTGGASGIMSLFPSSDIWLESNVPADLVINEGGTFDSVAAQADALGIDFGTIWNSWQIASLGKPVTTVSSASWRADGGTYTATTSVVTQQVNEAATGTVTSLNESVGFTQVSGRLTARQSVSYIRSRPVVFVATGIKQSTRLYSFLDETDVTNYCTQATRLYLAARSFNYSTVPFQFGSSTTERQVFLTFNTDNVQSSNASNFERTFSGSILNDKVTPTNTFTSIRSSTDTSSTTAVTTTTLSDPARNIIAPNAEITAFNKGEVIRGAKSGATAIVILHEQSTAAATGQPDGVLDTLHVVNVRGTFIAGEQLIGTLKRDDLNGGVLTLSLRASNSIEVSAPGVLVSTGTGRIAGTWMITSGQVINNVASPKFLTGNRIFSVQDTTSNAPTSNGRINRTTYADCIYSATGIIDAGSGTTVGVRLGSIGVGDVTRDRSYIQQLSSNTKTTYLADPPPPAPSNDPLAQTFIVSSGNYETSEGSFITEVELFFQSKDSVQPVSVELRTTSNGYPTNDTLPFAQKYVYPSEILTSSTGSVGTTVRFPVPVYVKEGTMYSVIVTTASPQYKLWVSTLDGTDQSNAKLGKVLKNPAVGSLFKSQNSSTWQESPTQDLKINIFRAVFNTTTTGTTAATLGTATGASYVTMKAADISPLSNTQRSTKYTSLALNAFRAKLGQSEIIVRHPNHGMSVGSSVSYMNVTGADQFGFANAQLNTGTFTETQYDIKTSTFVSTGTMVKHNVYKVYSHDIYSIRLYDAQGAARLATSSGQFGGDQMMASRNVPFTVLHPAVNVLNFQSTSTDAEVRTTSGRSPTGNETPYLKDSNWTPVTLNDNNYFNNQRVIFNKQNEIDKLDRANSFDLRIQMKTSNRFVSPVVDMDRAMAICTENRIDDPVSTKNINGNYYSASGKYDGTDIYFTEYDDRQGGAQMGYITRKLQFQNTSKLLKIQMAASIPSNCGIDKSTPSVTLPVKFQAGSRISEHPAIITQRSAITTAYPVNTTAITLQAVTNLVDGMYVYGPGVQTGTRINGIAGSIITLDKATKAAIPSTSAGSVFYFTSFDITQQDKTRQIDVGDYVTYTGSGNVLASGTYVTAAPKNSYFTKQVGSYSTGKFVLATAANPVTLTNTTIGGIDPTTNNMTIAVDDISNIKQGMYCYVKFYNSNDGTFDWAPATIRRVLRVNTDAKSITLQNIATGDEFATSGYSPNFFFNANNNVITFFNPVIKLNQATLGAIDSTMTGRVQSNLLTFTSPPNAELEVYAKISNGGSASSTAALQFYSNEYNASTNPYGVDSTNDIIYFPVAHNLNTGSPVLYNAQANTVGGLVTGTVYYAVFVSTTSIKLAKDAATAAAVAKGTVGFTPMDLVATSVQESHTITDVNQKNQASIEDSLYFRILPDTTIGGDATTYGGNYPLATGKGQLTYSDDDTKYIDHSFTVDNLDAFNTAVIKIVMRSRNPAFVSKVKDLRIIATA